MTEHLRDDVLNDWADGTLPPGARAATERHLAECGACRDAAYELRALLGALHALPREIPPARDLLPGIVARIEDAEQSAPAIDPAARRPALHTTGAPVVDNAWRRRTIHSVRVHLAAAAIVLIALSSLTTALLLDRAGRPDGVVDIASATDAQALAAEAKYREAAAELEALLREVRHALPPETARLFDQSLAIIDRALAETGTALRADPGNTTLTGIIIASYEKKLELLRRATELAET